MTKQDEIIKLLKEIKKELKKKDNVVIRDHHYYYEPAQPTYPNNPLYPNYGNPYITWCATSGNSGQQG